MPSKYKIFISHRLEDRSIAFAASGALRLLSDKRLEPFVCEDIPGGRDWRDWIYEKIDESDILLFLYTDKRQDWMWCFYEIGLFLNPRNAEADKIICLRDPSIDELPSPLEKYQAYEATEKGITDFLKDLFYKGKFTHDDRINENVFADDSYLYAIKDFLRAFKSLKVESQYFVKRAVFNLEHIDPKKGDKKFDDVTIASDNSYTMQEILSTPGKSTHWQILYNKFKGKGEVTWLDEIKETIENLKRDNAITYVMKPFTAQDKKKYLPFLTRVEKKPSEGDKIPNITPIRIYVIFIPCSDIEEKGGLIDIDRSSDPKYLLGRWQTTLPTSVVRVQWGKKSGAMVYSKEDIIGEPVVYAINPSFANFYDFDYTAFPDPDGDNPITSSYLLERVEKFVVDGKNHIKKINADQAKVAQKIIFEGSDASAKVPFIFNENHPHFPNSSYLPCLVSKSTVGDINGPHITYLSVMYVRVDDHE